MDQRQRKSNELLDKAWRIVRRVIEEADGRYGLRLYGRVDEETGAFSLVFLCPKMNRRFGHWIDDSYLASPEDEDRSVAHIMHTAVRVLAEERDTTMAPFGDRLAQREVTE